jgi:phosphinothricin acetyltransferase
MSSLVIRPAIVADIPAITAIYAHAVTCGTASLEIEPPGDQEMTARFRALIDGGFPYVVAESGRGVHGYAYAGPYRTRIAYRYTLKNSVYVAPDFHRQGIGRALMEEVVSQAGALGFRQMIAVIGDSAQVASIALHRAAGFEMAGTFAAVGFKFGRWHRYGADAAPAGRRSGDAAVGWWAQGGRARTMALCRCARLARQRRRRFRQARFLPYHDVDRPVDRPQHPIEFMPAPEDQPGRGYDAVGSLPLRQPGILFDAVDGDFGGSPEY